LRRSLCDRLETTGAISPDLIARTHGAEVLHRLTHIPQPPHDDAITLATAKIVG